MSGGNSSNDGNSSSGSDDDESWSSKFLKVASVAAATAAVAGGLYALLKSSSSSNPNQQSPFESRASRVIKDPDDNDKTPSPQIRWTKPEFGWVKLNVDGSRDHFSRPPTAGCGGVLRDSSGKWLLGFAQKLDPSFEVHETEIEAILKGLELAFDLNYIDKLIVESDNESVVSMVENGLGGKYNRIRKLCSDRKWEVKVVYLPKELNRVADRLANNARRLSFEDLDKYYDPPPNCITLVREDAQG